MEMLKKNAKKIMFLKYFYAIFRNIYFELKKILKYKEFCKNMNAFNKLAGEKVALNEEVYPCLSDKTNNLGFEPHYTYHPAWAARIITKIKPVKHVDISSHFASMAIISAFVEVDYYEYRPEFFNLDKINCKRADLLCLPMVDDSVVSLSCMHVIERVGLGRYGDKLDPKGDLKAAKELKRILAKGGNLIIVVPVGRARVMYNAHRIYSYSKVIEMFEGLRLEEFALIPDNYRDVGIIKNAEEECVDRQEWGCGCFWFKK